MKKEDAFNECLELIKKTKPKGTWSSYRNRFVAGKLKDSTIQQLLLEYGYRKVQDEDWTNEQDYYSFVFFIKGKLQYYSIQAETKEIALDKICKTYSIDTAIVNYKDVTNIPLTTLFFRINNLINE